MAIASLKHSSLEIEEVSVLKGGVDHKTPGITDICIFLWTVDCGLWTDIHFIFKPLKLKAVYKSQNFLLPLQTYKKA